MIGGRKTTERFKEHIESLMDKNMKIVELESSIEKLEEENKDLRTLLKKLKSCFNCGDFSTCYINQRRRKICKDDNLVFWQEKKMNKKRKNQKW